MDDGKLMVVFLTVEDEVGKKKEGANARIEHEQRKEVEGVQGKTLYWGPRTGGRSEKGKTQGRKLQGQIGGKNNTPEQG